jgi:hypothetical protein
MMSLRTLGIALVLLAVTGRGAAAQPDPALTDAVRAYDPAAAVSTDPALVHTEDFNGDGRPDVAAVLESEAKSALVIFHRTPSGFRAFSLYASLPPGPLLLRVVPPGRHRVLGPQGTINVSAPALELIFPGKSSAMYVWGANRYQVYPTENYR